MRKEVKWVLAVLLCLMFVAVFLYDWFIALPLFSTMGGFVFIIFQIIFASAIVGLLMFWKQLKALF